MKFKHARANSYQLPRAELILSSSVIAIIMLTTAFSPVTFGYFSSGETTNKAIFLLQHKFQKPSIIKVNNYDCIIMDSIPRIAWGAGKPELPVKEAKILIPQNTDFTGIDIEIRGEKIELPGTYFLEPSSGALPLSKETVDKISPDAEFYNSTAEFPGILYSEPKLQSFRGYSFLILNLYPVQYIPKTGIVYYYSELDLTISLPFTKAQHESTKLYRGLAEDRTRIAQLVDNPENLSYYDNLATNAPKSPGYVYLIITDATLKSTFQSLVDWRVSRGISATIESIQNITANYPGADTQEKIRNYIKDKYLNWGVEYVLLGTDDELLPHRGLYVNLGDISDSDIPSDLYYGCLDGTWNTDNDTNWGEPGEEDYYAEVYVGRAPVNTVTEATTFINKLKSFEGAPRSKNITLHGTAVDYYGTTTKDIKEGGTETDVPLESRVGVRNYLPKDSVIITLYDTETTIDQTKWENEWKQGRLIINHGGHGNVEEYYINYQGTTTSYLDTSAYALTNSYYPLHLTIACYTGSFDGRDTSGGYVADRDCIAEEFIINPTGGCSACIMNSRYGLYGGQSMPIKFSGELDVQFYNQTFNCSNYQVGKALQLTREHFAPLAAMGINNGSDYDAYRWVLYEWNLLGDPCMELIVVDKNLPDLTIENITFSSANPSEGDVVAINATVKNVGINLSANNVNVSFYVGNPKAGGTVILTVNVGNILAGGSALASVSWNTTNCGGLNNIYVKADSTNTIAETNELNNTAIKTIAVQGYKVELSCPSNTSKIMAGATATYNIQVKNLGTFLDTIILNLTNTNASWTATLSTGQVTLDANSYTTVCLNVTAPLNASPQKNVTIYVKGMSQGDTKKNSTISTLTTVIPTILLVDDESGTDETFYKAALDANGYKYDYVAGPTQSTGWAGFLMQYKIVIWFVSTSSSTLTTIDQQNLATFLDNGGKLLVCGEDIGYEIKASTFYANYLHATYIADNAGVSTITGVASDPIGDGFSGISITGSWPDEIGLYDSYATRIFNYTGTTKIAALKADTSIYKVVYFACEYFEGGDSVANKATIMDRTMKWFEPVNDVSVKSIDYPADGGEYQSGAQYINATVINNGKNAQSNFSVSCKVEEVTQAGSDTTILSEDFIGSSFDTLPSGAWTVLNNGTGNVWTLDTTDQRAEVSYSSSTKTENTSLATPLLDLSSYSNVTLTFWEEWEGGYSGYWSKGYVLASTNGGSTWGYSKLLHNDTGGGTHTDTNNVELDISSWVAGKSNVKIAWRYYANYDYHWYIDNVRVKSITPTISKVVFNNNQTVTTSLAQYATKQVSWAYNFQNATDYIITVKTWLGTDESKGNDAKSITITIAQMFAFSLEQGWNYIALPLNTSYKYAGELANAIQYCQYIKKWDSAAQSYIIYEKGSTLNNFSLENGIGYFVLVTQATDFTIDGSSFSKQTLTLNKGWNSIGRFNETVVKASDLAKDIGSNCTVISYWDETLQRFVMHPVGTNISDFNIERGKGYFAYMAATTVWNNI